MVFDSLGLFVIQLVFMYGEYGEWLCDGNLIDDK